MCERVPSEEIEITRKMIEAGAGALLKEEPLNLGETHAEILAERVLRAALEDS
jgi:hypothetical protein